MLLRLLSFPSTLALRNDLTASTSAFITLPVLKEAVYLRKGLTLSPDVDLHLPGARAASEAALERQVDGEGPCATLGSVTSSCDPCQRQCLCFMFLHLKPGVRQKQPENGHFED